MLDEDEWSRPRPGLFIPKKDLVRIEEEAGFDHRARLDWYGKFRPLPVFESRTVHPLAGPYNDYAIPANLSYI